jgi:hypothetical protein
MFHPTPPLDPFVPSLLTRRTSFFSRGGEYLSTLVPGLLTTAPPFASSPTFSHPQIKLQYLHRQHQQHQPSSSSKDKNSKKNGAPSAYLQKSFENSKAFGIKQLIIYKFNLIIKGELKKIMNIWQTIPNQDQSNHTTFSPF